MNKKFAKLIMITPDNNNKYYIMEHDGISSTFDVKFGRIEGGSPQTKSYPISKWDSTLNSKVKKGYKDVSELVAEDFGEDNIKYVDIQDKSVNDFIKLMMDYTNNLVKNTYSVKASNVTEKQIYEAQRVLDELNSLDLSDSSLNDSINQKLIDLYTVIPRKMKNVKDHLLPNVKIDELLVNEQTNLDSISYQVSSIPKSNDIKEISILDELKISMKEAIEHPEIQYLLDQSFYGKVHSVFEINKPSEDDEYHSYVNNRDNKDSKFLLHGTRCSSVIPIIKDKLRIRPSGNFKFSGKAYGQGNYFSEVMNKSLNYTGYDKDKILFVYEVHVGNPFIYEGWYRGNSFELSYNELNKRGYDSTYVKAGNGLLNSEIITYTESQNKLKYIIWIKE